MGRMRTMKPEYWDEYGFSLPRLVYAGKLLEPSALECVVVADWRTSYVYHVFSRAGCLLYVGYTAQPYNRWCAHRRTSAWWRRASTMHLYEVYGKDRNTADFGARYWETQAIRGAAPLCNLKGPASLPAKARARKATT